MGQWPIQVVKRGHFWTTLHQWCGMPVIVCISITVQVGPLQTATPRKRPLYHRLFCQIFTSVDDLTNLCNQATPLIRLLCLSLETFYCIYETFYETSLVLRHENNTNSIRMGSHDIFVNYIRFWLPLIIHIVSIQSHIYQHESQHGT